MKWIQASESDMFDMFKKHWRCGITKEPLTVGVAYNLFFNCKTPHPVEVLDESAESDSGEQVRKLREGLGEMVRCAPVNTGNMLESPVTFADYWVALENAKQLLTETK